MKQMCTGFFTDAQDDFFYGMPSSGAFSLINGAEGCLRAVRAKKKEQRLAPTLLTLNLIL
jgi:hypothetical protein